MDTHSNRWISTSTASGSTTYGYDAEGNTLNVLSLATTTPATVDLNDRLTSWNWQTYTYDADGNLTGNGTDTYVWNARNQLATVKQGSTTIASFSYDPLGRRIGTDFNGNAASYLYDGLNAVQETHGSTATSILTGRLAVDERFARTDLGGRTDFLSDALNSTMALTNSAGAIVEQYSYDPYGTTTASVSGFDNPYQYTGRENDGDGLYYYRARYYAPAMGRFISEDPLGFGGGGENFYSYVFQDPSNLRDPSGLDPELLEQGGAGIILTGGGAIGDYVLGRLRGDSGMQLLIDTAEGAGNGFLSFATESLPIGLGMGARAAGAAGITAAGDAAEGQCLGKEAVMAALFSLIGDSASATSEFGLAGTTREDTIKSLSAFYGMSWSDVIQAFGEELATGATPDNGLMPYMPQKD